MATDIPPTVHAKNFGRFYGVNKTDLDAFAKWHREHATAELRALLAECVPLLRGKNADRLRTRIHALLEMP